MGVFKILGFAALGVGAVAAAPVAGVAGVVAASVARGVVAASATKATVDYATEKFKDYKDNIRQEGYEVGFREAEVETKKKFLDLLKENDNLRLGVFALSLHVAKLDGLDDSEAEFIEKEIGRPDGTANAKLRDRFQSIWTNDMSFSEIKDKFLNGYSDEILTELDDLIRELIKSDNVISDKEQDFVDNVWAPYLKERLN